MQKKNKGFTLIEMLVVVLIIGILAGVALPQYQMAVTKAKVASILPLMRRWKDALAEYKLQHGSYKDLDWDTVGATLGVNWPSDWKVVGSNEPCGDSSYCGNDFGDRCGVSSEGVVCVHDTFQIVMYNSDLEDVVFEEFVGLTTCEVYDPNGEKVCKALGGKLIDGLYGVYKLN